MGGGGGGGGTCVVSWSLVVVVYWKVTGNEFSSIKMPESSSWILGG